VPDLPQKPLFSVANYARRDNSHQVPSILTPSVYGGYAPPVIRDATIGPLTQRPLAGRPDSRAKLYQPVKIFFQPIQPAIPASVSVSSTTHINAQRPQALLFGGRNITQLVVNAQTARAHHNQHIALPSSI